MPVLSCPPVSHGPGGPGGPAPQPEGGRDRFWLLDVFCFAIVESKQLRFTHA